MMNFIRDYWTRPWPKLEVPPMRRQHTYLFGAYVIAMVALGWYIWFSGNIQVEYFLALGLGIPLAFFLKSRFVTLIGLLSFPVVLAFIYIGNQDYAFYIVAGLMGAIIAFESPIVMYMILIAAVWFDKSLFSIGHPLRMEFIIGSGLLVGWLFKEVLRPRESLTKILFPERWLAISLLIWAALGAGLWSYEPYPAAWLQLKAIIVGVLFFLISPLVIRNEKQLDFALIAWVFVSLVAAAVTNYAQPAASGSTDSDSLGAVLIAFKNITATFLSYSFFIALAYYHWAKSNLMKVGALLIMTYLLVTIVLLYSRGTMFGLAVGVIVFWICDTFISSTKRSVLRIMARCFLLVSIVIVFLLLVYVIGFGELIGGYADIFYSPLQAGTMEFRISTWDIVLQIIMTEGHQLRGVGLGGFWILGAEYGFPIESYEGNIAIYSPHNLYLDILLHYGVIGLLLFFWLIILNLSRLWRITVNSQRQKFRYLALGFFCSLIAYYTHGLLDGQLYSLTDFWLYLGLTVGTVNVARRLSSIGSENTAPIEDRLRES
jgi:O-antigen ligase